jgi:hypothetical protein
MDDIDLFPKNDDVWEPKSLSVDYMSISDNIGLELQRIIPLDITYILFKEKWLQEGPYEYYKIADYNHPSYGNKTSIEVNGRTIITLQNYMNTGRDMKFKMKIIETKYLGDPKTFFKCEQLHHSKTYFIGTSSENRELDGILVYKPFLKSLVFVDMLDSDPSL